MIASQLILPTIDMRPVCPACHQPADILGEWSPGSGKFVCRKCSGLLLEGLEAVFESSSNSLGVGLRQEEEFAAQRERYQMRAGVVFELVHGCQYTLADMDDSSYLPCMKTDLQLAQFGGGKGWKRPVDLSEMRWHCKRCRNK